MVYGDSRGVEVRDSTLCPGRGVFALRPFDPGDTVELCPVLVIPTREHPIVVSRTFLLHYQFPRGQARGEHSDRHLPRQ